MAAHAITERAGLRAAMPRAYVSVACVLDARALVELVRIVDRLLPRLSRSVMSMPRSARTDPARSRKPSRASQSALPRITALTPKISWTATTTLGVRGPRDVGLEGAVRTFDLNPFTHRSLPGCPPPPSRVMTRERQSHDRGEP
jgi:hypothetical protein